MKYPFLVGTRLYLRGLLPEDAQGAYPNWLNDGEVCQYNGHHRFPYGPEQARDYIASASGHHHLVLAVCLQEGDTHIGNIALTRIDPIVRQAELTILMGEKTHWGKGYAKEAARLLCAHGFKALNLNRIHCGTSENNQAMQSLASHLGMQEEGRRREAQFKNGRYWDMVEFGVLRDEFFQLFAETQGEKTLSAVSGG